MVWALGWMFPASLGLPHLGAKALDHGWEPLTCGSGVPDGSWEGGGLGGSAGGNEVLEEVGNGCPWVVPLGWGRRIPSMVLLAVLPDASPQ